MVPAAGSIRYAAQMSIAGNSRSPDVNLLPRTVKPQPSHRRNEPMYLAHIVAELARDRGEEVEVTAAATTATARAFFGLPVGR